ncbi:MAG TPA: hypothetical protein VGR96_18135 [Acidobacteriaceae bacterium]|nr:hypothetical protein [Acidobacteriaceae bacterium]
MSKFGAGTSGHQQFPLGARLGRLNGLMIQMTDRTRILGRVGMMMPDIAKRHPEDERENRYREDQAPKSFSVRHF